MLGISRGFRAFIGTQFLGAFNDNLFKALVLLLAASVLFPGRDLQGLAMGVFSLPFILFSGIAGELSERFGKQRVMLLMKWAEVAIMLLGVVAFQLQSWNLLLATLFIMGTQSAFFGPPKYGSIPELVEPKDLIRANGLVSMTTFLAVLVGQAVAGPVLDSVGDRMWILGLVCVALALVGTWTATNIPRLPATRPDRPVNKNPFGDLLTTLRELRAKPGAVSLLMLNSAFYFNAAVVQLAIIGLGAPSYLNIGEGEKKQLTFVLASLSAAVGIGSLVAPRLAKRVAAGKLAAAAGGIMFVGQLGFNAVGTAVSRADGALPLMHACAIWVGLSGAAMAVPIVSLLQFLPEEGTRGRTFGATNFVNWVAIFLSAGFYHVFMLPAVQLSPALAQSISGGLMVLALFLSRKRLVTMRIQ